MFDGHLERPLETMSVREKLEWLTEAAALVHKAKLLKKTAPPTDRRPDATP